MLTLSQIFFALIGSKWVRRLALCFAAVAAYAIWEARVEQKGADRALVKVETKANADTEVSNEVRSDVSVGKRGKPDPHRRP